VRSHLTADKVGRFVRHKRDERAILGLIEDKDVCDERLTAVDLARAIYRRPRPIQAEHVAALRAIRSLVLNFRIALY
jgi:hypothetical protein